MRKKMIFALCAILSMFCLGVWGAGMDSESQRFEKDGVERLYSSGCTGMGVFANFNTNCIQFIDPATNMISPPYLKGYLGSYAGGLMDVVVTPDGSTAVVSNFGDQQLYFVDISGGFGTAPALLGQAYVNIPAEDMAISPDGQYVLVTDGGAGSSIAVVDIGMRVQVFSRNLPGAGCQAIAIAPDGQTVIAADYNNGAIHALELDSFGRLLLRNSYTVEGDFRPANIAISPDGQTVIVVLGTHSVAPIFTINGVASLSFVENIALPARNGQSCIFSGDGTKAYYITTAPGHGTQVHILDVTGAGQVSASGTSIDVFPWRGYSVFYGIDCMAIDPSGNYLYVTNSTNTGALETVEIIDLNTNTQAGLIKATGFPSGIAFTCGSSSE